MMRRMLYETQGFIDEAQGDERGRMLSHGNAEKALDNLFQALNRPRRIWTLDQIKGGDLQRWLQQKRLPQSKWGWAYKFANWLADESYFGQGADEKLYNWPNLVSLLRSSKIDFMSQQPAPDKEPRQHGDTMTWNDLAVLANRTNRDQWRDPQAWEWIKQQKGTLKGNWEPATLPNGRPITWKKVAGALQAGMRPEELQRFVDYERGRRAAR